jgi:type IV secretion system protein VirB2
MAIMKSSTYELNGGVVNDFKFQCRKCLARALHGRTMLLLLMAYAFSLHANAAPAGALPWEKPMTAIATSLTGPVAYAIGLIGIAIAGGAMLWGGELTEFGRRACMIGLVVSVLVFAAPMLASAFGVAAALV